MPAWEQLPVDIKLLSKHMTSQSKKPITYIHAPSNASMGATTCRYQTAFKTHDITIQETNYLCIYRYILIFYASSAAGLGGSVFHHAGGTVCQLLTWSMKNWAHSITI